LKADRTFLDLHRELVEVEDQIQYARRYYNGAARNYNICVESFPGNLVARLFRFRPAEFFQVFQEQALHLTASERIEQLMRQVLKFLAEMREKKDPACEELEPDFVITRRKRIDVAEIQRQGAPLVRDQRQRFAGKG
jgi:hypothetical protein